MNKILKIQFWKAEKALAMQVLEQEGYFRDSEHVCTGLPELCCDRIYLCDEEERGNLRIYTRYFNTSDNRDEYLENVIRWISEEQFAEGSGELKIGEMCEVRDYGEFRDKRRLLAILPDSYNNRFITEDGFERWCSWQYARPIHKRTEPKIEECGQLVTYTWEEK